MVCFFQNLQLTVIAAKGTTLPLFIKHILVLTVLMEWYSQQGLDSPTRDEYNLGGIHSYTFQNTATEIGLAYICLLVSVPKLPP